MPSFMPSFLLTHAKSSANKSGGGRKANKDTDRNESDREAAIENTPPVVQPEPQQPVIAETPDSNNGNEQPQAEDDTPTTGGGDSGSGDGGNSNSGGGGSTPASGSPIYSLAGSRDIGENSNVVNIDGDGFAQVHSATIALSFNADWVSGRSGLLSRDAAEMSGDGNHLSLYIHNGILNAILQDGDSKTILSHGGIQAGQDYHVALSFGDGEARLAVDGAVVDSGQTDISWATSNEFMQIGALGWRSDSGDGDFSNVFHGSIADVAVYDGAMNDNQLVGLTSGDFTPEPTSPVGNNDDTPTTGGGNNPPDSNDGNQQPQDEDDTPTTGGGGNNPPDSNDGNEQPQDEDPANPTPSTGGQASNSGGGEGTPVDVSSNFSVSGGRVTTLQVNNHENVDSIRILNDPSHGNLTVNPDNTLALVLSHEPDFSGRINFNYEVTYANGSTQVHGSQVNVQTATQQAGWGEGRFYMLEEDENGDVIVEHGDNHRAVHISGSGDALSLRDIAALEGLNTNQITQEWLISHSEYGSNPDMALDSEAGMRLWYGITGEGTEPSSNWLLFERGYEYDDLGRVIDRGTVGEDPMHPIHITSYGDGAKPVLNSFVYLIQESNENIVFSDLAITEGFGALSGNNLMFDNVDISNPTNNDMPMGINVRGVDGFTLHNSSITDVWRTIPDNPSEDTWTNHMSSGLHVSSNSGVLVEGTLFDHNGWAPDYEYDGSTDGGLPPTMFNHNLYIQDIVTDFTLRDNIIMQGASYGAKVRPGGFVEDNVLLDNNNAATILGGLPSDTDGIRTGNFSLVTDNVITSAAHRETSVGNVGAVARGVDIAGMDTTLIDNIIAHLADPDNPDEILAKTNAQRVLYHGRDDPYYDDTIIYNWAGSEYSQPDQNAAGLNTNVLDNTTIQNFTQQLLGDPNANISDLAGYLRAQADGSLDHYVDADLIIDFFQTGFGLDVEDRLTSEELRFVPNALGDGIRWDNRLNWTTEDLPGTINGDSVDLGGNWVNYGGMTSTIDDLDLGDGGRLNVTSGRLNVEGRTETGEDGGTLNVSNVGQIWMDGYRDADELTLNISGGRFANTGDMDGNTQTTVTDGQAILATDGANYDIGAGSRLHIDGSEGRVGFDGEDGDTAVMRLSEDGTLRFSADRDGFAGIEEFRSGAFGDSPDVASGANLGLGALELDLAGLSGSTGSFRLMSVDEMIGEFSDIRVIGLAGNRNAELVVDYETDTLMLNVTGGGRGRFATSQIGDETDMDHADSSDILAALTAGQGTYSDDLPTEVEVNGEDTELADMLV